MFCGSCCSLPTTIDDMAVMSAGFRLEERGLDDKLFHTKAIVRDRACALTIDHWSSINAADGREIRIAEDVTSATIFSALGFQRVHCYRTYQGTILFGQIF